MNSSAELISEDIRLRPSNSEVKRLWADINKINKTFGWEPRFGKEGGFSSGLQKTINWFSDLNNLTYYKSNILTY
jgi:dTDP-glucose 4,6-dehydratase